MSESLTELEKVFMAFADKTRLRLLYLMRNGEVSVNYLCESLEISQPKVSRHLAYLRSMDIVHTRRDGKWIFYSLNVPESRIGSQLLSDTIAWVGTTLELAGSGAEPYFERTNNTHIEADSESNQNIYVNANILGERDELEIYLL